VASEDGRFFSHCGVRPESVLRAALQNVLHMKRVSGASTITMQAVRLASPHRKNLFEKFLEAVRAVKVEFKRDKLWILSQYLNRAPFGSNFTGVEAAAQGWFGKSAKALGPGEAAMLAGLVQAPSRYRPDRHMDRALKRRDYVLQRMAALGFLDGDGLEAARSVLPVLAGAPRPFLAPHYCDWYMARLENEGRSVPRDVATPLDPRVQSICEAEAASAAKKSGCRAAVVVASAATGEIVALADSEPWQSPEGGMFPVATAHRSAGSTLKTFLCTLAFDTGAATPSLRLADAPSPLKGYNPVNFDSRFRARTTLHDALLLSLNVPFVRLLEKTGGKSFEAYLRSLGFALPRAQGREPGLGMIIGNVDVSLTELVLAYREIAAAQHTGTAISPAAAWLVSDILSSGGHGSVSPRFAWKTGTSSAFRDAWTVAWNPEYVIGVWCGRLSGNFGDVSLTGSKAAAPAALAVARALYPQGEGPWFAKPAGVATWKFCRLTGLPAGPFCPETEDGFAIVSRSSLAPCNVHRMGWDGVPAAIRELDEAGAAGRPVVAKPADGAVVKLAPGEMEAVAVFAAAGVAEGERVWWFVDGACIGESVGAKAFAARLAPGGHSVECATAAAVSPPAAVDVVR